MEQGVEQLNENKVGHPFVYLDECFMIMALFRNTVGTWSGSPKLSEKCMYGGVLILEGSRPMN